MNRSYMTLVAVVAVVVAVAAAAGDDQFTKDKQECAPHLAGLSPCLPYVGGNGKTPPTMDCCTNLKQVLQTSRKCVCLLVKYRNEPGLGVKVDTALALGLPAVCHATPIYNCPALLNLAPDSPDAKVFTDFYKRQNATSPSSTPLTAVPTVNDSNSNGSPSKRRLEPRSLIQGILVLILFFGLSELFTF